MKSLAIVTDYCNELSRTMKENVRAVFEESIEINNYYIDTLDEDEKISEDCILVMLENRIDRIKQNVVNQDHIIVVSRTILEEKALNILKIPENSEVLIVNDFYETALQLTTLLYQLRIKNLRYETYKEGELYCGYEYAITCGIPEKVPSYIKNIIDVGVRVLDTSTFLQIINKLQIKSPRVTQNLLKYVDKIVTIEAGMKSQFIKFYEKNEQFSSLLERTSDGIILLDKEKNIILCNSKSKEIMGINSTGQGLNIDEIFGDLFKGEYQGNCVNRLIKFNNKYFLVTLDDVGENNNNEKILVITDITYVKKMESTIRSKLKSQGLIAKYNFKDIVHESQIMKNCISKAERFAQTNSTVLIYGESGTGKELFAQSIHNVSSRKSQPFVAVNCAAIPAELLESELFGYEKGAFTGANSEGKTGLFEQANHGTIFLDEIGDMPLLSQAKLLRVIQEKQIMRIGKGNIVDIDIRIIAATNKNLYQCVLDKTFREDLYYRLSVLTLNIPSLNQRKEDVLPIFIHLTKDNAIPTPVRTVLEAHGWKGNVRELSNVAEYYLLMKETLSPLPDYLTEEPICYLDKIDLSILHILGANKNLGREKLRYELAKNDCEVSEYELRKRLAEMERQEYISVLSGRQGCAIRSKGINFISNR